MVFQQNHLSRLDPGEVQYFIDHFEKMFSASQDRSQFRSSIVAGFSAPEEYLGIAENTVDRGSQLVAHIGQESRLCAIGRFRLLSRQLRGIFGILKLDLMLSQLPSLKVDCFYQFPFPYPHLPANG